jgi:hypothetical protein
VAGPADLEDITSAWVQQHQPAHAPPGSTPTLRS